MDPAAIVGVLLGFVAVFGTQILEGGSPMSILLIPPLFLIFVGSAGASLASNTMPGMIVGDQVARVRDDRQEGGPREPSSSRW